MIHAEMIHGGTPDEDRDQILKDFKAGNIRAVTNCNVLTTGFNAPALDALIMLRPTKSTSLYVQMLGRGMRLAKGKENCLVLDFAGNVMEHGPIDLIQIQKCNRTGQAEVKKAPTKECPQCLSIVHAAQRLCADCGYEWPERELKHDTQASGLQIMGHTIKYVTVDSVSYALHQKEGSPPSVKATYQCGLSFFNEWVCFEHRGYAQEKAWQWWRDRFPLPFPKTSADALTIIQQYPPIIPEKIKVKLGTKYPEIVKVILKQQEAAA
jgi:DNA repair protein RadD